MRQWQCPTCMTWVDAGWWRHSHMLTVQLSRVQMTEARAAGVDPEMFAAKADTYLRTGKEPTREAPDAS